MYYGAVRKLWISVLAAILLLLAGCSDLIVTASFDSYAEAEDTGFVERGWIPDYIPATAGKIEEAHDLDTNQNCGKVDLHTAEIDLLKKKLPAEGFASLAGEIPGLRILASCLFSLAEFAADNQLGSGIEMSGKGDADSTWVQYGVLEEEYSRLYYWIGKNPRE